MKNDKETKAIFAKILYAIAEEFGGKISKNNLELKFFALQEYSIEQITQAATWILKYRTKTFPAVPTTKEFIDIIENFTNPILSLDSKAEIQASEVLKMLKLNGRDHRPAFKDAITQMLMTNCWPWYGWASFFKTKKEEWWKKDFIQAYKAYSEENIATQIIIDYQKNNKRLLEIMKTKQITKKMGVL